MTSIPYFFPCKVTTVARHEGGVLGGVYSCRVIGGGLEETVGIIADAGGSPSEIGGGDSPVTISGALMEPKADRLLFPSPNPPPAGLPAVKTRLPSIPTPLFSKPALNFLLL